jgi:hypothetical protein
MVESPLYLKRTQSLEKGAGGNTDDMTGVLRYCKRKILQLSPVLKGWNKWAEGKLS